MMMDTQPEDAEPRLLTKDQVVELFWYLAAGAGAGAVIGSQWGVLGVILGLVIVGAVLFAFFVSLIIGVNFLRRYFWRRRHRRNFAETTD
jgi:hypothetical protein